MSSLPTNTVSAKSSDARRPLFPPDIDRVSLFVIVAAFAAMYVPSYMELARVVWPTDEQGHGPIILAVSAWLIFRRRFEMLEVAGQPARVLGGTVLAFGLVLYIIGRSQAILMFEVSSQIAVLTGLILLFLGVRSLRSIWFPLFFLLFMVPLPEALVAGITGPLKSAVSAVASDLLYYLGYPVARAGVVLSVGQYQLLVADACAGLNSMFTLEALGLLYMNLMGYKSAARNITLALLLIPIAFIANIIRVMILVLVTYHFGDAAGQGFVHDFAGMVLFMAGLVLMLLTDRILGLFFAKELEHA